MHTLSKIKVACIHLNMAAQNADPRLILSIAQAFKKADYDVGLYCSEYNPRIFPELHKGIEATIAPPQTSLSSVLGATTIFGKIKERIQRARLYTDSAYRIAQILPPNLDLLIFENDYSYKIGVLYKQKNPNAKTVWIMNNPPFYHARKSNMFENLFSLCISWFEWFSAKKYAKGIDMAVVYDKENQQAVQSLGIKTKLIGNPLEYERFYRPFKERDLRNRPIQILSVGALSPLRRFEDTVSAVAILRRWKYDVRALIICKDYWQDTGYRKRFEKHIADSGVSPYIDARFSGVSEEEMSKALTESDIALVPNNAKVWVATACEAMAAGMPLIISNTTSMVDVLQDGVNALFFNPMDTMQIAVHIEQLILYPDFYAQIAKAGQVFVKDTLSFDNFIKEISTP